MLIGLAVAAPVGPMAILCIRKTLGEGMAAGIAFGAGIAIADATYALIAAAGVTAVTDALSNHETLLRIAGGIFMAGLGCSILYSARSPRFEPAT